MMDEVETKEIPCGYFISLLGKPTPWSAPKYSKTGTYDTKWEMKRNAVLLIKSQNLSMLDGPMCMDLNLFMPYPKSTSKKRQAIYNLETTPHLKKIDRDNMQKMYSDVLTMADVISDDAIIWDGRTTKVLSGNPRTEIKIYIKETL